VYYGVTRMLLTYYFFVFFSNIELYCIIIAVHLTVLLWIWDYYVVMNRNCFPLRQMLYWFMFYWFIIQCIRNSTIDSLYLINTCMYEWEYVSMLIFISFLNYSLFFNIFKVSCFHLRLYYGLVLFFMGMYACMNVCMYCMYVDNYYVLTRQHIIIIHCLSFIVILNCMYELFLNILCGIFFCAFL